MTRHLLDRRRFNAMCATLGWSLTAGGAAFAASSGAPALAEDASAPPGAARRTVKFANGAVVPAIGQGSWHLGQGRHPAAEEEEALRVGLAQGMTLIDTAEIYGSGRAEELIGRVIAGQRDQVFLVSKVAPFHVAGDGIAQACAASLARLGTDHLDLYLLHWSVASAQFPRVVAEFERLRAAKKIGAWGVSNFSVGQMEELFKVPDGQHCATNQVPYSLNNRRIERELLPWCQRHGVPVMAYSPLGGANNLVVRDPTPTRIGAAHDCTAAAVALAWAIRGGNVIAIPESGAPEHAKENAVALSLTLTPQEIAALDAAYPGPAGSN
jgi:diketogulonate reductase-like aldo/keto reductase